MELTTDIGQTNTQVFFFFYLQQVLAGSVDVFKKKKRFSVELSRLLIQKGIFVV